MSTDTLERDLAQYLMNTGYRVEFQHSTMEFIWTYVWYHDQLVAKEGFFPQRRRYTRAAKWAKRQIRDHQRAMRQIGGLA